MICPVCGSDTSHVLETRNKTYRRRECKRCKSRWSTYETVMEGSVTRPHAAEMTRRMQWRICEEE